MIISAHSLEKMCNRGINLSITEVAHDIVDNLDSLNVCIEHGEFRVISREYIYIFGYHTRKITDKSWLGHMMKLYTVYLANHKIHKSICSGSHKWVMANNEQKTNVALELYKLEQVMKKMADHTQEELQ